MASCVNNFSSAEILKMWNKMISNSAYGRTIPMQSTFNIPINVLKHREPKKYYCETFDISDLPVEQRTIVRMIFSKFKKDNTSFDDRCMTLKISQKRHGTVFIEKLLKNLKLYGEENVYGKKVEFVAYGPETSYFLYGIDCKRVHNFKDYVYSNKLLTREDLFIVLITGKDYKFNQEANHINKFGSCSVVHIMLEK